MLFIFVIFFSKVKVYLSSIDVDGRHLDTFDVARIKISVSKDHRTNEIPQKPRIRMPNVILRRLSKEFILNWTKNSNGNQRNGMKSKSPITKKENKSTATGEVGYMTRSRTMIKTTTVSTKLAEHTNDDRKNNISSTKKRKSDCLADETKSKKMKIAKNTCIETLENENIDISAETVLKNPTKTIAKLSYAVGEVIWGKIRGWPHWPAKVVQNHGRLIEVEWFNDYRTTKLYHTQMFKFYPNYDVFAEKFQTSVGLKTAATEALIYIMSLLKKN